MELRRVRRLAVLPLALGAGLAVLAGCSLPMDNRGSLPPKEAVADVKPGKQTREQVTALLGSPSTRAAFGPETWFYIGQREERFAFFRPTILERRIIEIRFTKAGKVAAVREYDASHAKNVAVVSRVTPTKGKELTFLQQIIGNVGRFSSPQGEK